MTAALTTGVAYAADTITVTSPSPAASFNTTVRTVAFHTTDPLAPGLPTTASMTRTGTTSDTITGAVSTTSLSTVSGTFDLRRANPGTYDVAISQGAFNEKCTACFTVLANPVAVSSISPSTVGENGTVASFVINGSNFAKGPYDGTGTGSTVQLFLAGTATPDSTPDADATLGPTLNGSGQPAPTATTLSTITLRLVMGTTLGAHNDDVVVTNSDGSTATCTACLHVGPEPVITAVAGPVGSQIGLNATGQQITVSGHDFAPNAVVSIAKANSGTISFTKAPGQTATQIVLTDVNTTAATTAGTWAVTVANPDLFNVSPAANLTVTAAPAATALTYGDNADGVNQLGQGAQGRHITVGGTGLDSGVHVLFSNLPSTVKTSNQQATVAGDGTGTVSIQLDVPQGAAEIGSYAVRLVNADGGTSAACLTPANPFPPGGTATPCPLVIAAGPTVTAISSPTTVTPAYAGALTITGTNLHTTASGVHVVLSSGKATYFAGDGAAVDQGNGTQTITLAAGAVKVPASATAGTVDVTVTNLDDGGTAAKPGLLSVSSVSVTGVSPEFAGNTGPVTGVQIAGADFDPAATVALVQAGQPSIAGSITDATASSLTADFDLTNVGPGAYQVVVTNPAASAHPGSSSEAVYFTVIADDPTAQSVDPLAVGGGATHVPVTVTGSNFFHGTTMSFDNPAITLVPNSPPVISPDRTQITQLVNVASDAAAGTSNVTVTNSGGSSSAPLSIDVDPAPVVFGVTPSVHSPDPFTISVAGTGFAPGATLAFGIDGVHATNIQVSPDEDVLTADLTFDAGIVPADEPVDVPVTVVNSDGGRATTPQAQDLVLDPEPRITSATPTLVAAGKSTAVVLTGANFENGAVLTGPSDLTLSDQQFKSAGEFDVTVTVDGDASRGIRTLTLTNPDGGSTTQDITVFVVPDAPTGLSITPDDRSLHVSWTAPDNGGSAITSYTVSVTPTAGGATTTYTPDGDTTTQDINDLSNGTSYDVSVFATNLAGDGAPVTDSQTPRTVPAAPAALAVTPGNHALHLTWTAPDNGGSPITGYTVTATPQGASALAPHSLAPSATSDDFSDLHNGTAYDVSVVATNAAGSSTPATATATPRTVPGAPTINSVTPGDQSLAVDWSAPADNGGNPISTYTVTATPHAGGATTSFTTTDAGTTSHTFPALVNGTLYDIAVVAHNAAGDGAGATAAGTPRTVPGAPASVTVTPKDGELDVSWSPAADGGNTVDSYTVTATPHGGTALPSHTLAGTATSDSFTSLTNGTLYDIAVVAHNAAGNGSPSTASGTPRTTSGAPTAVTVTAGDATLTVSWSAPSSSGGSAVATYTATVTPHSGGTPKSFTTTGATTTSHVFSGLTNGTLYDVSVVANNAAGSSPAATGSGTPRFTAAESIADSASSVIYGKKVTLSGTLTRSGGQGVAGATVAILRTIDGQTAARYLTVTTDSVGHWAATFTPARNATYAASYAGSSAVAPATSGKVRTTVAPRVLVTSPVNKSSSSSATPLKVTGNVGPNKAGRVVTLYSVTSTGKLVKIAATHLSSKSTYAFTVALKRGAWRLRVVIAASPGNVAGRSGTISIKRT